jgi:small GTP-binding protein
MQPPPIKAVLIGDARVGKTSLFSRLEANVFHDAYVSTVAGAFTRLPLDLNDGTHTEIGLWDTAGQEQFRTIVPFYFQDADILLMVYDTTDRPSFQSIDNWVDFTKENGPERIEVVIIGNKIDLMGSRVIEYAEAQEKSEVLGAVATVEVSAKTGSGIEVLVGQLKALAEKILAKKGRQEGRGWERQNMGLENGRKGSCC